ncbi:MAG: magnesium transporter MgtE [Gemmatales bacterium]|nr:MAG: magnesium transporter MgtE [Gemmatales bacterium]
MVSERAAPLTEAHLNDPVKRHMRHDVTRLHMGQTVDEALAFLRQNPPGERVIYFYVVDENNRLCGVVPARRLLLSSPDQRVDDIMIRNVVSLPEDATVLEACEFFMLHKFLAFPVLDKEGHLLGVVDVGLYTDELSGLGSGYLADDLFQLIGVHVSQARQTSPLLSYRNRFPWLLCNIAGGILAAFVSGFFQDELDRAVELALFIPVVLALAESVSIQSVSLALESFHSDRATWSSLFRRLRYEGMTGLLLGLSGGVLVGLVCYVWLREVNVMISLIGGIAGGVTCAAIMGASLATTLRLLNKNPHVAAGPIALTCTDIVTLFLYFNLARFLL